MGTARLNKKHFRLIFKFKHSIIILVDIIYIINVIIFFFFYNWKHQSYFNGNFNY